MNLLGISWAYFYMVGFIFRELVLFGRNRNLWAVQPQCPRRMSVPAAMKAIAQNRSQWLKTSMSNTWGKYVNHVRNRPTTSEIWQIEIQLNEGSFFDVTYIYIYIYIYIKKTFQNRGGGNGWDWAGKQFQFDFGVHSVLFLFLGKWHLEIHIMLFLCFLMLSVYLGFFLNDYWARSWGFARSAPDYKRCSHANHMHYRSICGSILIGCW